MPKKVNYDLIRSIDTKRSVDKEGFVTDISKDGGIIGIIHRNFADEGYPVQQHEDDFKKATELLLKENGKGNNTYAAQYTITKSILGAFQEDSLVRPSWKEAEKKAGTIIKEINKVIAISAQLSKN